MRIGWAGKTPSGKIFKNSGKIIGVIYLFKSILQKIGGKILKNSGKI